MIAFKADAILGGVARDVLMGNATPAQGTGFGLKYEGGSVKFYAHSIQYTKSGVTVAAGDTVIYGLNYNASTGEKALKRAIAAGDENLEKEIRANLKLSKKSEPYLETHQIKQRRKALLRKELPSFFEKSTLKSPFFFLTFPSQNE
ncbi:MAG: hypothetical protein KAJ07_04995 [Planctomycetes bacterium]|nr:hypothetical protein [Planctomycetota bacterium]